MANHDEQLMLDVSQAHELKLAFRRAGYSNADIKRLSEGDLLSRLLPVIRGQTEVAISTSHIIDYDVNPFLPDGWKVEEHHKGGQLKLPDIFKIQLYLSERQKNGETIGGDKLRQELEGKPVLNANVLDWLLTHTEFIPEEWKNKTVSFWGTIYNCGGVSLSVRYLYWNGVRWNWHYYWLGLVWGGRDPAALSASI